MADQWEPLYIHDGDTRIRVGKGWANGRIIETMLDDILPDKAYDIAVSRGEAIFSLGEGSDRWVSKLDVFSGFKEEIVADKILPLQPDFDRQATAKRAVVHYINSNNQSNDPRTRPDYVVFVVWFTSVLKNWKALVSTTIPDGCYYEVTYNGDTKEIYIDVYEKKDNVSVVRESDGTFRKAYFDNVNE